MEGVSRATEEPKPRKVEELVGNENDYSLRFALFDLLPTEWVTVGPHFFSEYHRSLNLKCS